MKKFLNVFGYGFRIPFTPVVVPFFVLPIFACVAFPIYYALPDGYGEIPGWANTIGLIGLGIGVVGVAGSLIRGSLK
jgi:prepilin signal peptidase PulO-like enzyme (type II secretory pathway)